MTPKHLFTLAAVIFFSVALTWSFAPSLFYAFLNVSPSDALLYMGRRYSAYIYGAAVTMWLARSLETPEAQRVVMAGGLVTLAFTGMASLYGALSGTIGSFGWVAASSELGVAACFAYLLFAKREASPTPATKTAL